MTKFRFGWAAVLVTAALACLDRPLVRAEDGPGNEVLKKHGLKIAGALAVAEEEAEIKTKLSEARRISKQLSYLLMQQQGTMSPQDIQKTIKTLNTQINQLKTEINAVNRQMSMVPRSTSLYGGLYGGRYGNQYASRYGSQYGGNSFANNYAAEMYAEFLVYRNQLQMELNQDSLFLNQIKNQGTDPKAKDKLDAEVRDQRDAYHQAILDLRKLVDAATAKYEEADKNDEVKKALNLAGKGFREKPKLGPSREFLTNVKLVEKLERAESNGETEEPQAKPSRRGRHRIRAKNSSKAATAGNSGGASSP